MSGLQGIIGRIAAIEARFALPAPVNEAIAAPAGTDPDPFGDAYRAAVGSTSMQVSASDQTDASQNLTAFGTPSVPFGISGWGPNPSTVAASTNDKQRAAVLGVLTTPGRRQIGGYGSMPVPDNLRHFGNGNIPAEELSLIGQGQHRLQAEAAASWKNLVAAASDDGVDLKITDSYRSLAQQVDLVRRKGLYTNGGLAATPGTSNHGWGLAVDADVTNRTTADWLAVNGPRFGWVESVPREPWHWEFRPGQV
ncbi:MAG: D-alanyl-D-alanine carboxypeptidase [Candidatus Azotimanducaceae bacterium]|jgi:D-alanyl-D-alanine carboxypeptidase|tara:strand:- start:6614 stop:7369 length:756 start_codon:yes stop_codon:yes gene_type:complete